MISKILKERIARVKEEHARRFGAGDTGVIIAPYRICPLGAHVDHQLGRVTGMALENGVILVFRPNSDGKVNLFSLNFPNSKTFSLNGKYARAGDWGDYARGAAMALSAKFTLDMGIDAVLEGDLPIGGLSSSAAVGVAYLIALETANSLRITARENIEMDRMIENGFIGLENGILDQSVILLSKKGSLLYLDCGSNSHEAITAPETAPKYDIVVAYSGVKKSLGKTNYNKRVDECEEAARKLMEAAGQPVKDKKHLKLGHVPDQVYAGFRNALDDVARKRADHYFMENARVEQGLAAWRAGDIDRFGALMKESCESSIVNYECGCPELMTMADILNGTGGVYGARFSGAGFRGCCIGLSNPERRDEIKDAIDMRYPIAHPQYAGDYRVHFCGAGTGARLI